MSRTYVRERLRSNKTLYKVQRSAPAQDLGCVQHPQGAASSAKTCGFWPCPCWLHVRSSEALAALRTFPLAIVDCWQFYDVESLAELREWAGHIHLGLDYRELVERDPWRDLCADHLQRSVLRKVQVLAPLMASLENAFRASTFGPHRYMSCKNTILELVP